MGSDQASFWASLSSPGSLLLSPTAFRRFVELMTYRVLSSSFSRCARSDRRCEAYVSVLEMLDLNQTFAVIKSTINWVANLSFFATYLWNCCNDLLIQQRWRMVWDLRYFCYVIPRLLQIFRGNSKNRVSEAVKNNSILRKFAWLQSLQDSNFQVLDCFETHSRYKVIADNDGECVLFCIPNRFTRKQTWRCSKGIDL